MKTTLRYFLAVSVITVSTAITAFSDPTYWIGGTGSVADPGNWDNGLPDNSGSNRGIVQSGAVTGGGDDFNAKELAVYDPGGVNITSDLTLTDADINLYNSAILLAGGTINITLGSGGGGEGYISVKDTSLLDLAGGNLTLGGDSIGTVQQSGGTVLLQNGLLTLGGAGGTGEYQLSGGTLRVNDVNFTSVNSWIDMDSTGSGVFEVSTNNYSIANAQANISNGLIRRDSVIADTSLFSITEEGGFIKVEAIPEPAVIGLIGIGGLGMLIGRRISKRQAVE